mmetsp:Transcript_38036/g.107451  ORF Transcript_38036/g.107451 Transcript_38036/m.107451 type:complete len:572 (+) Transcript_38036:324-2039(+)|eukprot:CAMPEP_0117655566 /NCGR_PEP_ID=MMETSP0804-20121206/4346_1 /TAXON_ID=1074897 /ORGANISM="Tetraselmis astigmatica, Strain CCMP880" /LENGTH=571 /DNA_ID=CAMNT_0005461923 /DNA_START=253 /DNA_END=1968 /DNA_ORIENTATION=+
MERISPVWVAVIGFLALQVYLFAGYHFHLIQLEEEADIEHELQLQLRRLVEDNHNLQSKAEQAHIRVATERAQRRGLQLQLLRAGMLPLDEQQEHSATEFAAMEKELSQRQGLIESAIKDNHQIISGSFLSGDPGHTQAHLQDNLPSGHGDPAKSASQQAASATAQQQRQRQPALVHPAQQNIDARPVVQLAKLDPVPSSERVFPPSNEDHGCPVQADPARNEITAGVVVVAFNRAQYLETTIESILSVWRDEWKSKFPLYVSQDGGDKMVRETVLKHREFKYLNHVESKPPQALNSKENLAYYRIANHYKFILMVMFDCLQYKKAIILEDDMKLSVDFFEYFQATAPLLEEDETLYAVSSWNDHGQSQFVMNSSQVYRSDFFPGLGWMLTRELWDELKHEWPRAYWDDWMRQNQHRKGRQSIRPEVCRTSNFGEQGTSRGQFYKKFIATIHLNTEFVLWTSKDMGFLKAEAYRRHWEDLTASAPVMDIDRAMDAVGRVKVLYFSQQQYEEITGKLGMLREWKNGIPRGAYEGVVPVRWKKAHIFISPEQTFKAIDRETGRVNSEGALIAR